MNEELLNELAEAMKRREKSLAGINRWTEQLNDANEDIAELSGRIAAYAPTYGNPEPVTDLEAQIEDWEAPKVWTPEQV